MYYWVRRTDWYISTWLFIVASITCLLSYNLSLHWQNPKCWKAMKHVISTHDHSASSSTPEWPDPLDTRSWKEKKWRGEENQKRYCCTVVICPSGTFLISELEIWPWICITLLLLPRQYTAGLASTRLVLERRTSGMHLGRCHIITCTHSSEP